MANNSDEVESILEKLQVELDNAEVSGWGSSIEPHRERYIETLKVVEQEVERGSDILDIGALPYHLTYLLQRKGYAVTGADLEPNRMKDFKERVGLEVEKWDIEKEKPPFERESFDVVLFNEVFEHLRINPIRALERINCALKPEGKLILSTPNLYSIYNIVDFLAGNGLDGGYSEFKKLDEVGHMGHVRIYSEDEMRKFLENTGFRVLDVNYRWYKGDYPSRKLDTVLSFLKKFKPSLQPDMFLIAEPE
ncbi:MAG: methyltransferase domain-containing protein [Candidatus Nanohaloarchaea archaeon]